MLSAIALSPSAPVLVPELAGGAVREVADFRAAAVAAAAQLPDRWIAVGVADADGVVEPAARGTFAGYGVDVPVRLSPDAPAAVTALPLCALFAGWLRDHANPNASVQVRACDRDLDVDAALARGRSLRSEIDETPEPVGVLVIADGARTLTPAAPGGYDPDSPSVQAELDDALAVGDTAALTRLPNAIVGRVAFQVLAGLVGHDRVAARELVRGAPYGVGYFVGLWSPRTA